MQDSHLKRFQKTFKCINAINDSDLKVLQTDQVKAGIAAG